MADYVLRYSATEFSTTVYDVEQLSAIRGASLTLLYSGELVEKTLKAACPNANKIYTGASQGAFTFAAEPHKAEEILGKLRKALKADDVDDKNAGTGPHSQMAYVVDIAQQDKSKAAILKAEALNDLQALQGESFPLPPARGDSFDASGDRHRPAIEDYKYGGKSTLVSANFKARHSYGQKQRSQFYSRFLGGTGETKLAENIEDMVADPPEELPISVAGKIAVFYADGNDLGENRRDAIAKDELATFSNQLQNHQKELLKRILAWRDNGIAHQAGRFELKDKSWCFETLLWGGDEVCFVMPAWLAMDFCQMFFEQTKNWEVCGKKITQAAGLVICNKKTPIRQIKAVAEELAEECKRTSKEYSLVQIEVFESLSLPDTGLRRYRKNIIGHYNEKMRTQLAIQGDDFSDFCGRITALKSTNNGLPRSQLYKLLRTGMYSNAAINKYDEDDTEITQQFETYIKRAGKERQLNQESLCLLNPITGTKAKTPNFINLNILAMLWDYVDQFGDLEQA